LSLSYFHYKESVDLTDDIQSFRDHYLRDPTIAGAPKSTEYGTDVGISASGSFYSWRNRLFLRPRLDLIVGIGNTYDGSTQGEPVVDSPGDTTGIQFFSFTGSKNNFLLFAGCDIGYALPSWKEIQSPWYHGLLIPLEGILSPGLGLLFCSSPTPPVLYGGIDFRWWYRDLTMTQDNTYYFGTPTNVETYTSYSLAIGLMCSRPVSPDYVVGFDERVGLMFYGQMKETVNTGSGDSTVDFPAVTLGNYPSFRLELFAQRKIGDHTSVKFAPYFLFYGFEKSNSDISTTTVSSSGAGYQQAFLEPSSRTYLVGCTLTLDFLGKRLR